MRLSVVAGVLDTLRVMPYVRDFNVVLTAGYRVESDGVTYRVEPYELGPVVLPSGKVVGCDPLVAHAKPFADAVAPGRYPLRAWVAVLHADGGEWQPSQVLAAGGGREQGAVRGQLAVIDVTGDGAAEQLVSSRGGWSAYRLANSEPVFDADLTATAVPSWHRAAD